MVFQPFQSLIGNESAKISLDAAALGRSGGGQVLLLSGPPGVGKRSFAQAFIQAKFGPRHEWKIKEGLHPDIKWLRPEGKSHLHLVSSIQEMQSEAPLSPLEAKVKVYVLEEAERMLPASSNALLKILEEPPPHVIFLLLTEQEEAILPTILSRCFKIALHSIGEEILTGALVRKGVERAQAVRLAMMAQGSYSRALELAEGAEDTIRSYFKGILRCFFLQTPSLDLIRALSDLDKLIEKKGGEEALVRTLDLLLEDLLYWIRDLHCYQVTSDASLLFHSDSCEDVIRQAQGPIPSLEEGLSLIEEARFALQRNVKFRVVLERFFLKIAEAITA